MTQEASTEHVYRAGKKGVFIDIKICNFVGNDKSNGINTYLIHRVFVNSEIT